MVCIVVLTSRDRDLAAVRGDRPADHLRVGVGFGLGGTIAGWYLDSGRPSFEGPGMALNVVG